VVSITHSVFNTLILKDVSIERRRQLRKDRTAEDDGEDEDEDEDEVRKEYE